MTDISISNELRGEMIAIYIIGGIVAYLLIGAVVAGLIIRTDENMDEDCWVGIVLWPAVLIIGIVLALVCLPIKASVRLAKFIGDYYHVARQFLRWAVSRQTMAA